ncbi:MAG: DUF5119 domain-containing protein [Rikenellaceae bacterium]
MRQMIKNISLLLLAAATIVSCHRKPIYDTCICENTLAIPISIDWTTSGIDLQNVTVLFYDAADSTLQYEHKYEHNDNDIQSYVYLPEGSYTAVVFNELRDQIDYVSCVGYDNLSTLKFESNGDTPLRSRSSTRSYVKESGDLAVKVIEGIEITEAMIIEAAGASTDEDGTKALSAETRATVDALTGVMPLKKNTLVCITAYIDNIWYALMSLVDLVNMADGYYVDGDQNSSTTSTLQFTMNNRTYNEDSELDGYITDTITTFGTLTDRLSTSGHDSSTPITLDILFQMVDNETTQSIVIDNLADYTFTQEEQSDGSVLIEIVVEGSLEPVTPADSDGDSGFGSTVKDWEDVVSVPLS